MAIDLNHPILELLDNTWSKYDYQDFDDMWPGVKGKIYEYAVCYKMGLIPFDLIPKETRRSLRLTSGDKGIDGISQDFKSVAQIKYRTNSLVTYSELSTFVASSLAFNPYKIYLYLSDGVHLDTDTLQLMTNLNSKIPTEVIHIPDVDIHAILNYVKRNSLQRCLKSIKINPKKEKKITVERYVEHIKIRPKAVGIPSLIKYTTVEQDTYSTQCDNWFYIQMSPKEIPVCILNLSKTLEGISLIVLPSEDEVKKFSDCMDTKADICSFKHLKGKNADNYAFVLVGGLFKQWPPDYLKDRNLIFIDSDYGDWPSMVGK